MKISVIQTNSAEADIDGNSSLLIDAPPNTIILSGGFFIHPGYPFRMLVSRPVNTEPAFGPPTSWEFFASDGAEGDIFVGYVVCASYFI